MQGKTIVVTGATSGIGQVAAETLAAMGARMVLIARDKSRGEAALARIRERGPGAAHSIHYADLSLMPETRRVAAEIAAAEPRIDVLINNAGALFNYREVTPDGLERTFATNHMSYYLLTHALRERLAASAPARVVSTASDAHRGLKLDLGDLQSGRRYMGFAVYGRSKLCNILFTREAARRLPAGVTATCLHPGFVATRFGDQSGGFMSYVIWAAKRVVAITPEKGADTIVYLASSPEMEGASGGYYYKRKPGKASKEAQDDAKAKGLWEATAKLAGVAA
jgi:NAD(P)-dependent dehydrogenase (short-subunit alcohol dehydrogenase family)